MELGDEPEVRELIALAKREDLGAGDVTARLLEDPDRLASFELLVKSKTVFAGRQVAPAILTDYDPAIEIEWMEQGVDGCAIDAVPTRVAVLRGPLGVLLAVERVFLNFLQRLCGVAGATRAFVAAVAGTGAVIYDTRKTTPGWRTLEKYAVRCGGGTNHRMGLSDAVLIKDNHVSGGERQRLAGALFEMLNRLPSDATTRMEVEVEAQSLQEVRELLKVMGIDVVLLDNFGIDDLRRAVRMRDDLGLRGKVALEASGGVTLATVRAVAETGVERISVGALTHSAPAADLSLERC